MVKFITAHPDPENHPQPYRVGNPKRHMSFAEDYRKGSFFVKHTHNVKGGSLFFVLCDFKLNEGALYSSESLEECIQWIKEETDVYLWKKRSRKTLR